MKVFFPFERPKNNFLDEIELYFQGEFVFDYFDNYDLHEIDVINIHWPEALFNWKEPSEIQIENFKKVFFTWKKNHPIVYTRHNIYPHYNDSEILIELYDFICKNVNRVIHLGIFSKNDFILRYDNTLCSHKVIEHPLYELKNNTVTKEGARAYFNIKNTKNIVLSFGKLRDVEEFNLLFHAYRKLRCKNKMLFISKKINFKFKPPVNVCSYSFNKYYDIYYKKLLTKFFDVVFHNAGFIDEKEVQYYVNMSDCLVVARKNQLNSGDLYLGLTFRKKTVIPNVGNMTEKSNVVDVEMYDPTNINTLTKAIYKSLDNSKMKYTTYLKKMNPNYVANETYSFFKKIL